MNRGKKDLHWS